MTPRTYWHWQKHGSEGEPPEECNDDPVMAIEYVTAFLDRIGLDNATKKKVKLAMAEGMKSKGLKLRRGRPEGSGLNEHTLEAFDLYYQKGYTEGQIGQRFDVNGVALKNLMSCIRTRKGKRPKEEREALALAHYTGRKKAAPGRAPVHKRKAPAPASGS